MHTAMWAALVAMVVIGVAGCAGGEDVFGEPDAGYVPDAAARTASADWAKADTITVELSEFTFSPATLTFRVGVPYRLILTNVGAQTHFFVSEGFFKAIAAHQLRSSADEVASPYLEQIAVAPHATKELLFVAVEPGTYELECTAFLHELMGMSGKISVV